MVRKQLGDGLVARHATIEDVEAVAALFGEVFNRSGAPEPNARVMAWTRGLMDGGHPTTRANDFTVVEDAKGGKIVSACGYIPQRWVYDGVEFGVGHPELVATDSAYRNRGLVRAQFDLIHRMSEERGHLVQVIDGIEWYYRQYGYEPALERWTGRACAASSIPSLPDGETERYRFRPANDSDLAFVEELYRRSMRRSLVSCIRDEAMWRFHMAGENEAYRNHTRIIETADGRRDGLLVHDGAKQVSVHVFEVRPGVSWLGPAASALRYLSATGDDVKKLVFWLQTDHPLYEAIPGRLPETVKHVHEAWYLRLPDVAGFLRLLTPVLERRMADSVVVGHSGALKLNFYRDGVRLLFDEGKVTEVTRWKPTPEDFGDVGFPGLTFLQTLFGYHSYDEVHAAFPDCRAFTEVGKVLINVLFPRRPSAVWTIW